MDCVLVCFTIQVCLQLMAPFTPFFCESVYQNLKKALPEGQPGSVHWCDFPEVPQPSVSSLPCPHTLVSFQQMNGDRVSVVTSVDIPVESLLTFNHLYCSQSFLCVCVWSTAFVADLMPHRFALKSLCPKILTSELLHLSDTCLASRPLRRKLAPCNANA